MNNDALYFSISSRGLPFKKTYQRYTTVFLARATRLQKQTDCKIRSKNKFESFPRKMQVAWIEALSYQNSNSNEYPVNTINFR